MQHLDQFILPPDDPHAPGLLVTVTTAGVRFDLTPPAGADTTCADEAESADVPVFLPRRDSLAA